jgi:hypothetical protein
MKIIPIIAALILFTNQASAQYYRENTPMKDSVVLAKGISELNMTETRIYKGKTSTILHTIQYNRQATNIYEARFEDTIKLSKIKSIYNNVYNDGKNIANSNVWYKYDQNKYSTFNALNQLEWTYYFDQNGKNFSAYHYQYADSLCLRLDCYKKNQKLKSYYLYSYAPNKKMQHSALYDRNDKLIRYWDYNCDDEGTVSKTKSDTLKICTEKKYMADGTVISTTNSFDYKGDPIKYVEYHNAQKQLIRYFIYRGKDDLLTYQVKNSFIGNKLATQYIWNADKKGKALSSFNYSYNAQGSLLSQRDSFFNGSKLKTNTYKFTYNSNDLLSSKSGYDHNGKLFSMVNYRYKYFVKKD